MTVERIVASSYPAPTGAKYLIESKGALGWQRMTGDYPSVNAAIAFAKAFAGPEWRIVEVMSG